MARRNTCVDEAMVSGGDAVPHAPLDQADLDGEVAGVLLLPPTRLHQQLEVDDAEPLPQNICERHRHKRGFCKIKGSA